MEEIIGYKQLTMIGEGGMATVYKGLQVSLNRTVAIKILSRKLAEHSEFIERFQRESLVIARLNNPHIIHIIDRGITSRGMPYFVMEYLEGTDLSEFIKAGNLNFNKKLNIIIQVCKALSYAHRNGVVHRDIKPGNVLIDAELNARVLDFGIAQFYSEESDDSDSMFTRPGTIMGTLPYMSPEQQISADNATVLSDLYSLGVLMYELFTGVKPLGRFKLPSEIDPALPKILEEVIMSCLNQEPVNRPGSADEIKDRLLKHLRGAHLQALQKQRASQGITKIEDKFALLDVIKEETYGAVYLYEHKVDQNLLVIKKKPSTNAGFMESKLLTSLKHKNITNILGVSRNEQFFIIVMEYLSGGSLNDRLIKPFQVDNFFITAREICEGLSFAHKNRIVHGNLRPSNILFADNGTVKISDFGLEEHYANSAAATNWYSLKGETRSQRNDIFAVGVVFYQMLTGAMPSNEDGPSDHPDNLTSLPLKLHNMVSRMLSRRPEDRQDSFDRIIDEIDLQMKKIDAESATIVGPSALPVVAAPALGNGKSKTRRIYWLFFFATVILSAMVAAYLFYSGELKTYINTLLGMWDTLQDKLEPFYKETLLPTWKRLMEKIRIFYEK